MSKVQFLARQTSHLQHTRCLPWQLLDDPADMDVPLLGWVSAGQPIEIFENSSTVTVPRQLVRRDTYALRVRGNSMIECDIHDGDVIIIDRRETAENGETAVIMINQREVTLKKLYIERGGVRLQPANEHLSPIYLANEDVEVLGVVMGIKRQALH
ncbi:repressor [Terasakiispira papahanaumokuakeensis]|uniref:Repressor n=1 Tax=Terasakiispira papahanaumokuakeensis TaxID=197479 RepID=A0A1E2VBG4_9GAMM|nr:LexA family transcriptional regulator [Terasakiispira papahanaumokuakeensis]ODC04202.1 repressor [Terasakiispira papahanaumokuakeensis]